MNLDNLTIAIRPRRDWEAVDLGILMARHWYGSMMTVWLIITLPLFIAAYFIPSTYLDWYLFVFWVVKPLFERPLLRILSEGVFGQTLSTWEVLKSTPRLWLIQPFSSLILRRLSPSRSMDIAVIQLEGLSGSERSQRLNLLHKANAAPAKWLTFLGVHLEGLIGCSMVAFIAILIPEQFQDRIFTEQTLFSETTLLIFHSLLYLSMSLVAPFYVACGFSLYLNRRVILEGWDLEIAFKQMRQRRNLPSVNGLLAVSFLSVISMSIWTTDTAHAQTQAEKYASERHQIQQELQEIVEKEPFHRTKTVRYVKQDPQKPKPQTNNPKWNQWLAKLDAFLEILDFYMEIVLWLLVCGICVFIAMRFQFWQPLLTRRFDQRKKAHQPSSLFGLQVSEQSLPNDISKNALALWQNQQPRAALALLYRASLAQLLANGVPLNDGSTESECLDIVKEYAIDKDIPTTVIDYFTQLSQLWRKLAYGHITPPESVAVELCQSWNQCWQGNRHER